MSEGQITTVNSEIADRFGAYLAQEEADAATPTEEAPAPPAQDAASAEPEQDASPDAEPDVATKDAAETEEPETSNLEPEAHADEPGIETLSQLAESFEVEEADLAEHLQIPNREGDGTVSLSEVISSYHAKPGLADESKQHFEALSATIQSEHDERLGELQKLTASMIAVIEGEPDVDWEMLRDNDPSEYLREQEKRQSRKNQVETSLKLMDDEMTRREAETEAIQATWRSEQVGELYKLKPEWQEAEAGRAAMIEVRNYLEGAGYPQEQIEALEDAKSILTVWKAAQWERLQSKRPEVKKRLRLLPRTLRSTAREDLAAKSVEQEATETKVKLRNRLAETGSIDDAANVMRGFI